MYELRQFGTSLRHLRGRAPRPESGRVGSVGVRRTPGLRREELAELSDVSTDYIKRLEQGRARPSLQVLKSVARVLDLSRSEYEHLCALTGHMVEQPGQVNQHIGPATRQLLDRLDTVPVAVFDATWTLLTYNSLGTALCGEPPPDSLRNRNMAWQYFTNRTNCRAESSQEAMEFEASLVAEVREAASRYPADLRFKDLIAELQSVSTPFAELWRDGATTKFERRRGVIDHPEVGPIKTDGNVVAVLQGDLRFLLFTAEPGSADAAKLEVLRGRVARSAHAGVS